MDDPFVVRVEARGYEVDANGHVAGTVLLQYAQHARWECLRAARRTPDGTLAAEVTNVGGLMDLTQRRLIADPGRLWRSAASRPELLGLA